MRVIVASQNPVKIEATRRGFERVFSASSADRPGDDIEVEGVKTDSGVSAQPMSDEETYRGAENRLAELRQQRPEADYHVAIEGGAIEVNDTIEAFAWVLIADTRGRSGESRSASYRHPRVIGQIGEAGDELFGETNIKQKHGVLGALTNGVIGRTELYEHAVVLALIPFLNSDLFRE